MSKLAPARRVALHVVSERRRRNGHVRDLLRTSEQMAALAMRDRALASRLALGTVSAGGMLDHVLMRFVKRPSSLEPRVCDALRLATFEACYLDTASSVVVSQGVELVRSVAPRAAGMANAVLRKVVAEARPEVIAARARVEEGPCTIDDQALVSGLPTWLLARVRDARGEAAARDVTLAQLEAAPVYAASNRAMHDDGEAYELLRDAGVTPEPAALPGSFALRTPAPLAVSGLVTAVDVVVSDLAAQQVARIAAPRPHERVLEVGQGRGTKSLLLQNAALASGGFCDIVGVDSEAFKTRVASQRMATAGLGEHVTCCTFDARNLADDKLPEQLGRSFDVVFVDAPCSGTGTMRRHPEIAWSLSEDALTGQGSLPELQLQILAAASARVREDGRLVYATCSLLPEENEQLVAAFLASEAGRGFAVERVAIDTDAFAACVTDEGFFQSVPARESCDGHFAAMLRRLC